jgi:hypothetical protein
MNIIERLAEHAHDLQQSVGGKHTVEVWAWVTLEAGEPLRVNCRCVLGETGTELCVGAGQTPEAAFVNAVDAWKKLGSPTSTHQAKVKELEAQATKLGYTLSPATV